MAGDHFDGDNLTQLSHCRLLFEKRIVAFSRRERECVRNQSR
jgi:hypothetical protein